MPSSPAARASFSLFHNHHDRHPPPMSDSSGEDSDVAAVARTRPALFRDEAPSSSPPPRPIVSSRPARPQPRFLGDQDDDNDATDDLFGNLDNVPNHRVPARLNPNDFDDLFKAAEAPSLDALQGDDDVGGINVDGVAQKKRRTVAKMNDERLLGPTGFPKLLEDSKRFKSKGKGHEVRSRGDASQRAFVFALLRTTATESTLPLQKQDLKRLMTMYQLWAHQMYPKTNLRDTLQTVEKLCHKRSVQVRVGSHTSTLTFLRADDVIVTPCSARPQGVPRRAQTRQTTTPRHPRHRRGTRTCSTRRS